VNASSASPELPAGGHLSLERLRALLLDEGGLMASLVGSSADLDGRGGEEAAPGAVDRAASAGAAASDEDDGIGGPAQLAAAGPRAEGSRADYELLIEAIYEGYLLHYGTPRVALAADQDLGLLAGDRLYALGLARLVALGDIAAVVELADTITLSALAQGAGEPELADAVWAAGARAIGWGSSEAHRRAKELVLAGSPKAIEAMSTSARGLLAPR
jgi:hypothetical protein